MSYAYLRRGRPNSIGANSGNSQLPLVPATQSDLLVDFASVDTHSTYSGVYGNPSQVLNCLTTIGFRHIRDGLSTASGGESNQQTFYQLCKQNGIDVMGMVAKVTDSQASWNNALAWANSFPVGTFFGLEGANEANLTTDSTWPADDYTYQKQIWDACHNSATYPNLYGLNVLAGSLGKRTGYSTQVDPTQGAGDYSPYCTHGNCHHYPAGRQPQWWIGGGGNSNTISDEQTTVVPNGGNPRPVIVTETGYQNDVLWPNDVDPTSGDQNYGCPVDVSASYAPRLITEHFLLRPNVTRVSYYELLDDPGAAAGKEQNFGLFYSSATSPTSTAYDIKPAGTALKNLFAVCSDPGTAFSPAGLQFQIVSPPSDLKYILLEKRDGSHVLLLWRQTNLYNPAKGGGTYDTTSHGPLDVTVVLQNAATVTVHNPSGAANGTDNESTPKGSGITSFTVTIDANLLAIAIV